MSGMRNHRHTREVIDDEVGSTKPFPVLCPFLQRILIIRRVSRRRQDSVQVDRQERQ